MTSPRKWTALLAKDDPRRATIINSIVELGDALARPHPVAQAPGFDLMSGGAGIALFYAYLAKSASIDPALGDPDRWLECCEAELGRAIVAGAGQMFSVSLCSGIPGLAWCLAHLTNQMGFELEVDDEIDATLLRLLERGPWPGDYDLISGLVGLGVYFIERLPRCRDNSRAREGLAWVLQRLDERATRDPRGIAWFTAPAHVPPFRRPHYPDGYYDLGLAHGVAGVIGLLTTAIECGVEPERATTLLDGAVAWLFAQALDGDPARGFPWACAVNEEPSDCRSAWCYGDPGVAIVLARAALVRGREQWGRCADSLLATVARAPREVVDPCICHGSAGLLQIFARARQFGVDCDLLPAARDWIDWTLALRTPGEGFAGYRSLTYEGGQALWVADPGLLSGATGVGLALLATVSEVAPAWDRALLLSGRELDESEREAEGDGH